MIRSILQTHAFLPLFLAAAMGVLTGNGVWNETNLQGLGQDLKSDQDQLKGTWDVVELVRGDTAAKILPNEDVKGTVTFEKNQFRFTIVPQGKDDRPGISATFVLDATRTPAGIDLTFTEGPDKGKTARGIYKLVGNELIVRIPSREPFEARPDRFDGVEGSKTHLFTLHRAKILDPQPKPSVEQWLREEYRVLSTSRRQSTQSRK
jgi:uncharacterized protein (TIGR03067 family)